MLARAAAPRSISIRQSSMQDGQLGGPVRWARCAALPGRPRPHSAWKERMQGPSQASRVPPLSHSAHLVHSGEGGGKVRGSDPKRCARSS